MERCRQRQSRGSRNLVLVVLTQLAVSPAVTGWIEVWSPGASSQPYRRTLAGVVTRPPKAAPMSMFQVAPTARFSGRGPLLDVAFFAGNFGIRVLSP